MIFSIRNPRNNDHRRSARQSAAPARASRAVSLATAAALALLIAGCQQHASTASQTMSGNESSARASDRAWAGWGAVRSASFQRDALAEEPAPDAATLMRNFPPSVAMYENASVPAGPTYRIVPPSFGKTSDDRSASRLLTETPTFVVEFVALPFWAIIVPPWTPVTWHSAANFPPSYTVAPPQN